MEATGSTGANAHGTPVQRVPAAANGKAAGRSWSTRRHRGKGRPVPHPGRQRDRPRLGRMGHLRHDAASQRHDEGRDLLRLASRRESEPATPKIPAGARRPSRLSTYAEWNRLPRPDPDRRRHHRRSRQSSTPRSTTRCSTRACSPTPTASTSASTTRCTASRRARSQYANFSGWDIYRSEVPLLAVVAPEQTSQMMTSLLNDAGAGRLAAQVGLRQRLHRRHERRRGRPDHRRGLRLRRPRLRRQGRARRHGQGRHRSCRRASELGQGSYVERPQPRRVPARRLRPEHPGELRLVARCTTAPRETLEYATADFAISQLGRGPRASTHRRDVPAALAELDEHLQHGHRLHPAARRVRAASRARTRPTDGWSSFGQSGFQEGNAAQYTWMVPQDLRRPDQRAWAATRPRSRRLDTFFQQLNAGPERARTTGQATSRRCGTPWIYDYAGAPYKTQADRPRAARPRCTPTRPGGEPGNDDLGAMSSWYVWAEPRHVPGDPGHLGARTQRADLPLRRVRRLRQAAGHDERPRRLDLVLRPGPEGRREILAGCLAARDDVRRGRHVIRPSRPISHSASPAPPVRPGAPRPPTRRRLTQPGR